MNECVRWWIGVYFLSCLVLRAWDSSLRFDGIDAWCGSPCGSL